MNDVVRTLLRAPSLVPIGPVAAARALQESLGSYAALRAIVERLVPRPSQE